MKQLDNFIILQVLTKVCLFATAIDYAHKSNYNAALITFLVFLSVEILFCYKDKIKNTYNNWYCEYLYKKRSRA